MRTNHESLYTFFFFFFAKNTDVYKLNDFVQQSQFRQISQLEQVLEKIEMLYFNILEQKSLLFSSQNYFFNVSRYKLKMV